MRCCVKNCTNESKHTNTNKNNGVTFHKLPKDPDLYSVWLRLLTREDCRISKWLLVCSDHFLPEDFDYTRPHQRRVKTGAVPTLMTPVNQDELKMASVNQAELKVCIVCLAVDVKMYNMQDYGLSEMFQNITGISAVDRRGRLPLLQQVCWECSARLTAAAAFREKALLSDALLKNQVDIKESHIALLKQNYSSLKSPLSVKTAFTSYDNEYEFTISENKEILNDETDIQDRKPVIRIIEKEKEIEEQYEAWTDFPVKTEIESDPIADNIMRFEDRKSGIFLEQTHFNDTSSKEHSEDEMTFVITEVQVNNNDKILRGDTQNKVSYINHAGSIVLVDKEKKNKPDVIGNIVEETSSEEDTQSTPVLSANKSKQTMSSEVAASNKRVRRMYMINDRIKDKIIAMKGNGLSVAAIAKETGISTSSINSWWRRYRKNGNTYRRSIAPRDQSDTTQENCYNAAELGKELETCTTIVRQRLLEAGLEHILMKKPERTVTMGLETSTRKALHRQLIIALKQEGMSNSRISYLLNTAPKTVRRWWNRWCIEGHMRNYKKHETKRKPTAQQGQFLIDRVAQEQTVHTPSLAKELGVTLK